MRLEINVHGVEVVVDAGDGQPDRSREGDEAMSDEQKLQWLEDYVTWPEVPQGVAGTDQAKPWIEGRDAAIAAVMRGVNETPADA